MGERLTEIFLLLFCEKNSDGTKNLRLKGKEMWQRIGSRIQDNDMHNISHFLCMYPEVVKLDLCYNDIGDEGIQILSQRYLGKENNLTYLNLMGCNITWKGIEFLCQACRSLQLKTLRLNGNKLGPEGGKFVAMLLGENETIQHLDMGDSDQTLASCMYFMSVLRPDYGTNSTLKVLDLSRVIPYSAMAQSNSGALAEAVGNMLKINSTLVEMHIQKCDLDGHDIENLLSGLKYNTSLLLLDIGYNRIGDHGIDLLSDWLRTRPFLLGLNVAGNGIGDYGARALSFGMPFSRLRMLDISNNNIKDDGIVDILNSIKKPYILRLLYIWGNKLGVNSHRIIARMLRSKVLDQENFDVKLYTVDGVLHSAFYPVDHYKHKYYCVMDHNCAVELRIKRNQFEHDYAQPKSKVKFQFYPRLPGVNNNLELKYPPCV